MNRRHFLRMTGSLALAAGTTSCVTKPESQTPTGWADSFDREMTAFMKDRGVPGGALAVVKNARLVYARGYGWANREARIPVRPESLFRLASVSKPITGLAVMKLIEEGKLSLETRAFPFLNLSPAVQSFTDPEPRLREITVRQLLQHTGGWDREKSFDPMFRSDRIAEITHTPRPAGPVAIIRHMLSQPLDFDPGTHHAYSNFGYCVLGRVIEKASGQTYEQFVRKEILAKAGIRHMRIGASQEAKQAPGEVRYYTGDNELGKNVFPEGPEQVPWPYGGFHLEAMDAHGGWIGSAVDLARLAAALNDPQHSPLLKPATFTDLYAPPPAPVSRQADGSLAASYYAAGWMVRPMGTAGRANYWHNGSLPGTNTLFVRLANGLSWAALFNRRSEDRQKPDASIDAALHRAAAAVSDWPKHDLFSAFQ